MTVKILVSPDLGKGEEDADLRRGCVLWMSSMNVGGEVALNTWRGMAVWMAGVGE